jgi:2,3-diketo-5-methylthio-1-phosphopentane phosphatase
LLAKFKTHRIRPFILSDSFSYIIENILRHHAVKGVKVYANRLRFSRGRINFSFPHKNDVCLICAHCKKKNLLKSSNGGKIIVYIGDGISDICAARHADLVFAKGKLLKYFLMEKRQCIPIRSLKNVYDYFNNGKLIWHAGKS